MTTGLGAMATRTLRRASAAFHPCPQQSGRILALTSGSYSSTHWPSPVYNVVGAVKRHSKFCEPEVESMAVWLPLPDRSSLEVFSAS